MTVRENVAYGLREPTPGRVEGLLTLVGIGTSKPTDALPSCLVGSNSTSPSPEPSRRDPPSCSSMSRSRTWMLAVATRSVDSFAASPRKRVRASSW